MNWVLGREGAMLTGRMLADQLTAGRQLSGIGRQTGRLHWWLCSHPLCVPCCTFCGVCVRGPSQSHGCDSILNLRVKPLALIRQNLTMIVFRIGVARFPDEVLKFINVVI